MRKNRQTDRSTNAGEPPPLRLPSAWVKMRNLSSSAYFRLKFSRGRKKMKNRRYVILRLNPGTHTRFHDINFNLSSIICPIRANYRGQAVMMKGEEMTHSCSRCPADQWRHREMISVCAIDADATGGYTCMVIPLQLEQNKLKAAAVKQCYLQSNWPSSRRCIIYVRLSFLIYARVYDMDYTCTHVINN